MSSPANSSSPLRPSVVPANAGIKLRRRGGTMLAFAQRADGRGDDLTTAPFELPRVFGGMIDRAGGTARCFWRRHQRSLAFLLYLDLQSRMWIESPPPQICTAADVRFNATFGDFHRPPDTWRLAGSIRSLPNPTADQAMLSVPPIDGLHLVFDPLAGWLSFCAFLCLEGQLEPITSEAIVLDEYEVNLDYMLERIWLADQL